MMGGSWTVLVVLMVTVRLSHSSTISPTPSLMALYPSTALPESHVNPTTADSANAAGDLDRCTKWERCPIHKDPKVRTWLSRLPNCPCQYPISILSNDSIFDPLLRQTFRWARVYERSDRARDCQSPRVHCIRQQLTYASNSPAVQVCCYGGRKHQLVTRGSGAGSAYLVAPEHSRKLLHELLDLAPLVICGGDWTRYQALRPPNNGFNCSQFPSDVEYTCQVEQAKNY